MNKADIVNKLAQKAGAVVGHKPLYKRDSTLASRVCRTLLAQVGFDELWSNDSPHDRAYQLYRTGTLSADERTVLRLAFDIWNGGGETTFNEIMALDHELKTVIGSLLIASSDGKQALEQWIVQHQVRQNVPITLTEQVRRR